MGVMRFCCLRALCFVGVLICCFVGLVNGGFPVLCGVGIIQVFGFCGLF